MGINTTNSEAEKKVGLGTRAKEQTIEGVRSTVVKERRRKRKGCENVEGERNAVRMTLNVVTHQLDRVHSPP
jgi:hypothetical protein